MDGNELNLTQAFDRASNGTLRIDVERYQHMLDNADLTDEQKRQVLEALWSIITTVVQLGYGVHPMQEVCGKDENLTLAWDKSEGDALDCEHSNKDHMEDEAPDAD